MRFQETVAMVISGEADMMQWSHGEDNRVNVQISRKAVLQTGRVGNISRQIDVSWWIFGKGRIPHKSIGNMLETAFKSRAWFEPL